MSNEGINKVIQATVSCSLPHCEPYIHFDIVLALYSNDNNAKYHSWLPNWHISPFQMTVVLRILQRMLRTVGFTRIVRVLNQETHWRGLHILRIFCPTHTFTGSSFTLVIISRHFTLIYPEISHYSRRTGIIVVFLAIVFSRNMTRLKSTYLLGID